MSIDVIKLAEQAGAEPAYFGMNMIEGRHFYNFEDLDRFAALVLEEAAKVCDVTPPYPFRPSIEAAHAIRALKPQE